MVCIYFIDKDVNSFEIQVKKKYTKSENIHFDGNDVNAMVTSKQQTYLIILFQRRADFVLNLFFFFFAVVFYERKWNVSLFLFPYQFIDYFLLLSRSFILSLIFYRCLSRHLKEFSMSTPMPSKLSIDFRMKIHVNKPGLHLITRVSHDD